MQRPGKKQLLDWYRTMVLIRKVEEKLMEVFAAGEIPGFIHVCIGQEAAPVAVCSHLKKTDTIATTHRGHGHALAKGISLDRFMAELFGKRNGPCRGRSGSMHLADRTVGLLGANGIVGGGMSIAAGAALASKLKRSGAVTVCCFGEGATGEGTFHESLNIASLMKLPVVFFCENNGWAEFTPVRTHMRAARVADRAETYGMPGVTVPNEFFAIYEQAEKAVRKAREGEGPSLLEVVSSRWHGHFVGDAQKYRPEEDVTAARRLDCIRDFEQRLLEAKVLTGRRVETIHAQVAEEIEKAVAFARSSPPPDPSELMEDLYVG